jgi:two-component system, OmpR family, phosphate regulon response regulator PhoB
MMTTLSMSMSANTLNSVLPTTDRERVLVVEDEDEIRELIALHLRREGLIVDSVASAEEAFQLIEKNNYTLYALDWMLPGASGVEITKRLRANSGQSTGSVTEPAILMITARAESADIVAGLEAGADDYLTKPFEPSVLLARVRALLRRAQRSASLASGASTSTDEIVRIGGLSLDPGTYEVKCCDDPIQLTPSEFKLLMALATSRGRVLTREGLIQQVQGDGVSVVGRTVDTHVFGLRKKLGDCADIIETIRGVGYRVNPLSEN